MESMYPLYPHACLSSLSFPSSTTSSMHPTNYICQHNFHLPDLMLYTQLSHLLHENRTNTQPPSKRENGLKRIYPWDGMLKIESMYPPSFISGRFSFYKTHMHASLHFPSHLQQPELSTPKPITHIQHCSMVITNFAQSHVIGTS